MPRRLHICLWKEKHLIFEDYATQKIDGNLDEWNLHVFTSLYVLIIGNIGKDDFEHATQTVQWVSALPHQHEEVTIVYMEA